MESFDGLVPVLLEGNRSCFVFATNDNYAPYLGVALFSFLAQVNSGEIYDICVLYTDLSKENQQKIKALTNDNCSIRLVNISNKLAEIDTNILVTHAHFSKEAYYRFFIPQIFANYSRVIYFDCDLIFLKNLNQLLHMDLLNKPMAAVLEYKFKCRVEMDPVLNQYAHEVLNLENVQNYFNSGVLIFDIEKLNALRFTQRCLEKLIEVQRPRTVDQCVINSVMQNNVMLLDALWNLQTHVDVKELKKYVPIKDYACYMQGLLGPHVIHYCSPLKPWQTLEIPFAYKWWDFAKKSTFYEEIVSINNKNGASNV